MAEKKRGEMAGWALTALLLGLLGFAALITLYSADDFHYAAYLNGGLKNYLSLMDQHYQTANGRTLVHLCATAVLHFGNWLFALVAVGCMLAIGLFGSDYLDGQELRRQPELLLFAAGMLAMPRRVLVNGVLWISAFFNYVLPLVLLILLLVLVKKVCMTDRPGKGLIAGLLALSFLAGATTETYGLMACACCGLYVLRCLWQKRGALKYTAACLASACAGTLTIFLSPATMARANREVEFTLETLEAHLTDQAELFLGGWTLVLGAALTGLLLAVRFLRLRRWGPAVLGLIPVAGAAVCRFWDAPWAYGILMLSLCLAALGCWWGREWELGMMEFLSACPLILMMMTNTVGYRAFVPYWLCQVLAAASCGSRLLRDAGKKWNVTAALAVCLAALVLFLPKLPHFVHNYQLEQENLSHIPEAAETGILPYCMDYDMEYTYVRPFQDADYYLAFFDLVGLDEKTVEMRAYGKDYPKIYVAGELLTIPAMHGDYYGYQLPIRQVLEAAGGFTEWSDEGATLYYRDRVYHLVPSPFETIITWEEPDGSKEEWDLEGQPGFYTLFLQDWVYKDLWGMTVEFDPEEFVIRVEP